jgi:hypothetical protein
MADSILVRTATEAIGDIVALDRDIATVFEESAPVKTLFVHNLAGGSDYYLVVFASGNGALVGRMNAENGALLEFSYSPDETATGYLEKLRANDQGVGCLSYVGGSAFYPMNTGY